jgi:hypothetical protein
MAMTTVGRPKQYTEEESKRKHLARYATSAKQNCINKVKKYLLELKTTPQPYRLKKLNEMIEKSIEKLNNKYENVQFTVNDLLEANDIDMDRGRHVKNRILTEITCLINNELPENLEDEVNNTINKLNENFQQALEKIKNEVNSDVSTYYVDLFTQYFPYLVEQLQ